MATTDQAIEKLIECVKTLAIEIQKHGENWHGSWSQKCDEVVDSMKSLSVRDSSAGTAEIDLCVSCKQRPCGCAKFSYQQHRCDASSPSPAKCEHEAKHVVSGYVSQNDVTCVICSQCSTVGKRFDGGPIEWWPEPSASWNERAISVMKELRSRFDGWGVHQLVNAKDIVAMIDSRLASLGGA